MASLALGLQTAPSTGVADPFDREFGLATVGSVATWRLRRAAWLYAERRAGALAQHTLFWRIFSEVHSAKNLVHIATKANKKTYRTNHLTHDT